MPHTKGGTSQLALWSRQVQVELVSDWFQDSIKRVVARFIGDKKANGFCVLAVRFGGVEAPSPAKLNLHEPHSPPRTFNKCVAWLSSCIHARVCVDVRLASNEQVQIPEQEGRGHAKTSVWNRTDTTSLIDHLTTSLLHFTFSFGILSLTISSPLLNDAIVHGIVESAIYISTTVSRHRIIVAYKTGPIVIQGADYACA